MLFEPPYRNTIHYTQLPDVPPDDQHYREWNTYRREMPRLLAEGHEGDWVLIKGDEIVGFFATFSEAANAGDTRFLLEPFMVKRVHEYEPLLSNLIFVRNEAMLAWRALREQLQPSSTD
jgi:hypothetical protein